MQYYDFVVKALEGASKIALEGFGKVTSTVKEGDNNQVLTETDLKVGKYLVGEIQKRYPEHNVIDEEAGVIDNKSPYTWVVDPIDGTSNFAAGVPLYGIMIGLLENDIPVAGGVALPSFSEIYVAEKGQGTFCNGSKCQVTEEKELKNVLACYEIDGHQEDPERTRMESKLMAEIILNVRNLRVANSVYDNVQLVKGNYGAGLNQTSKIWDNVTYQIISQEAGAIYTDFWGNPIDYSQPIKKVDQNFTFCCASPILHRQLQAIIHSVK